MAPPKRLQDTAPLFVDTKTARVAVRVVGTGKPILFVHGWPLSGLTWRKVVPLIPGRTAIVVDLPGCGDTQPAPEHDYRFAHQAETLREVVEFFAKDLGYDVFDVIAQDTGATIARQLAIIAPERIGKMVLVNTEIPHHRPPWIELFQKLTALPLAAFTFQQLMKSDAFLSSSLGFGGSFADLRAMDTEFRRLFIAPLVADRARMKGIIAYLRGIDWHLVDGLAKEHAKIKSRVLFVWGEDDPTFPLDEARSMEKQLPNLEGFAVVKNAKLMVHEERPDEVARHALAFLAR
jgi:pimeloyl-ACP methyl ester carboxylesterase